MPHNHPLVSIILPTYNGKPEWLSESIDSVLSQTFKDFELIIINDASTNNIEKTIKEYEKKDSRIVYLKNEKNLQLVRSLNKGIKHSKGKYIARIDDDDIWVNKDKLEKQVEFMELNPDYGLCGTDVILIDENGRKVGDVERRYSDEDIRNNILQWQQFAHASVIIRKSVLDKVGLYNPKFEKLEDYELWCRIGTKSKFANLQNIWIKYRINPKGICKTNYYYQKKLSIKVCFLNRNNYPNFRKVIILKLLAFPLSESLAKIVHNLLVYVRK